MESFISVGKAPIHASPFSLGQEEFKLKITSQKWKKILYDGIEYLWKRLNYAK